VPCGVAGYAMGVAFSAVMLFCVMMMADNWNYAWYMVVTKRQAMNVKPKLAYGIEASTRFSWCRLLASR